MWSLNILTTRRKCSNFKVCTSVQTLKMILEVLPKRDDVRQIIIIIGTQALQCNKTHFYSFLLTSHLLAHVMLLNKEKEKALSGRKHLFHHHWLNSLFVQEATIKVWCNTRSLFWKKQCKYVNRLRVTLVVMFTCIKADLHAGWLTYIWLTEQAYSEIISRPQRPSVPRVWVTLTLFWSSVRWHRLFCQVMCGECLGAECHS